MSRHAAFLNIATMQRLDWDPTEEPPAFTRTEDDIDTIELHHTGAKGPKSMCPEHKRRWLLAIERFHEKTKRWSDIFYHVFVFADGEIWIGRDLRRTSQGNISNALTVHVPGNNPDVTEPQYASLLRIAQLWATTPDNIRGHSQRPAATQCPGSNVLATIEQLQKDYAMTEHTHSYMDLSHLEDAQDAKVNGLWDGSDPEGAASRSVVAVMAQRALNKAASLDTPNKPGPRGPRGKQGPAGADAVVTEEQIRNAVQRQMSVIVSQVLHEMQQRLKS